MSNVGTRQRELQRINNERVFRRMRNKSDRLYVTDYDNNLIAYPKIAKDAAAIEQLYGKPAAKLKLIDDNVDANDTETR